MSSRSEHHVPTNSPFALHRSHFHSGSCLRSYRRQGFACSRPLNDVDGGPYVRSRQVQMWGTSRNCEGARNRLERYRG